MNNTQIVTTTGALVAINPVGKAAAFVAGKLNLGNLPKSTKENPFKRADLVKLAESKGHTKDEVKAALKEFDGIRRNHYAQSAVFLGAVAADPRFRKNMKSVTDKNGKVIGWNATVRREASASVSASTKIAQLEALVAKLTAQLNPATPVQA